MRIHYILDEGLAHPMQTGLGKDTVASIQSAVKYLHKSKEVMACDVNDIEVYPLGVTKNDYEDATPLKPEDKIPSGSTSKNAIFVHVPREKQNLAPEDRRIFAGDKADKKQKKAARLSAVARKANPSNGDAEAKPAVKRQYKDSYEGGHHLSDEEKCDIPKFMCYYQLGESVPYYIEVQGWEKTVGRLKERILETRGNRGLCPDLWGVTDITKFKVYPPGRDQYGKPKHPELDDYDAEIPTNSSYEDPIIVPAVRDTSEADKAKADLAKLKEQKKRRKSKTLKAKKEKPKPITVQVKTPDGALIPVEMQPSDTIQFIKEKVAPEAGVEVPKQVLHFNGKELGPNDKTATDMGLQDGSVVELQPTTITVKVVTPDGNTVIPVRIDPTDTIESIKEKLVSETGIEVPQQILTFNDVELPNEETAEDMGLQDGFILHLELKPITVQVRTPDGDLIPVEMKPLDTIRYIKEQVEPETGMEVPDQVLRFGDTVLPNNETANDMGLKDGDVIDLAPAEPKPITVHVKTPDGKTISVQMNPSDTIESIKEAVAPETGMEVPQQVLKHNGKELPNGETAQDMGLQDGSVIDLEPKPINVQVRTPEGTLIPVQMKPSDSIQSMKERVAPEAGIEVPQQVLIFKDEILPDDETAEDVGLQDGDIIDLEPRYITVQVKTPDGTLIPVEMKPTHYVQSIKQAVEEEAGIAVPQQILKFNGEELPDDQTADDVGLQDGDIIDLEPLVITVQVKTPDGQMIPVQMEPTDSIQSIKEKVAPDAGIEVPKQVLKFNDEELFDDETADEVGLQDGDIIDLEQKPITVHVKTPDGKTISVQMQPSDQIQSIKEAVAPEAGIDVPEQVLTFEGTELPNDATADDMGLQDGSVIDLKPKGITVHVKTPDGKTISVQMNPSDTIESIKEAVAPEAGIEVPDQVLTFEGTELPDEETADTMGLQDGSVIDLEPKGITVHVRTPDGKTISVEICPADTIESIKEAVAPAAGIEVPEQVLTFEGTELPDEETADDMGLKDGSVIGLSPKGITVHVRTPDGKTISVQMNPFDTIESIKEAVAPEAGIDVPQQVLKFEEEELPDEETADAMGLKDGSVIDLEPRPITVKVRTPDGRIIPVEMQPTDTILSIKENIAPEAGIDVPQQLLKFEGTELPNDETADAMGLQDGSVIDLEPKGITVNVKTPDGKTISVQMQPSDTIQSIKEAIATPAGIEVPKQVLKFEGNELPDEETADAMGLKDGSVVDLEAALTPEEDAEAKYKAKKAKKDKKKKKKSKDKDWDLGGPKQYSHEFNPTPQDLTRHKAHFMVGDQVPMEMICPAVMTIFGFKEEILRMKDSGSAIVSRYFAGIDDPNRLKIFAAGSWGEGDPLPDHILVPRDSSAYAMFSVLK